MARTLLVQVGQYADHPALMIWSFGNELNGVWNGFLQELDKATDIGTNAPCGWDERYDDLGGCWIHKGTLPLPGTPCYEVRASTPPTAKLALVVRPGPAGPAHCPVAVQAAPPFALPS